jgi:hypothetical protein
MKIDNHLIENMGGGLKNPQAMMPKTKLNLAKEKDGIVKVGRNDPCPCGSGLKYKKCCLGKTEFNLKKKRTLMGSARQADWCWIPLIWSSRKSVRE